MTHKISIKPIAYVKNSRKEPTDDYWAEIISEIVLVDDFKEEAFDGIATFSHLHIIYYFHKSEKVLKGTGHPRGNKEYPKVGIFAQRKKDRPNHLGLTTVKLLKHDGRKLTVSHLDAIDGTPVVDIKPFINEFIPSDKIKQPDWSTDIMKKYWKK